MPKTKPHARILYGGLDDESFGATTALGYLRATWAEAATPSVGQTDVVAKYRRKEFGLATFTRAIEAAWDGILSELEGEYAIDFPIGLEDAEDEFVAGAAALLLRLAKRNAVPRQCGQVATETWRWDGRRWTAVRGDK